MLDCHGQNVYFYPDLHPGIKETLIRITITDTGIILLPHVHHAEYPSLERFGEGANFLLDCKTVEQWYFELVNVTFTTHCDLPLRTTKLVTESEPSQFSTFVEPITFPTFNTLGSTPYQSSGTFNKRTEYIETVNTEAIYNFSTNEAGSIETTAQSNTSVDMFIIYLSSSLIMTLLIALSIIFIRKGILRIYRRRNANRIIDMIHLDDIDDQDSIIYSRTSNV